MTREEMIADVINAVKAKGLKIEEESFFGEEIWSHAIGHYLKYIKKENFSEIMEVISKYTEETVHGLILAIKKKGLLSVVPRIVTGNDCDVPTLMFRHDKFLSWFRGYRFQVSDTDYGNGDSGSSSTTLVRDMNVAEELPQNLQPFIAFSHVCEAAIRYEDFWDLVGTNPELFDSFMNKTNSYSNINCKNFSTKSLWDLIERHNELPEGEIVKSFALEELGSVRDGGTSKGIFGVLILADSYVALKQFKEESWNIIKFKKYDVTAGYDDFANDIEDTLSQKQYYSTLYYRLPWVLLAQARIYLGMFYVYNWSERGKAVYVPDHALNYPNMVSITKVGELDSGTYDVLENMLTE